MNGSTILMDIFLGYNMAVIIFDLFGTLIDIDDNQNDYDKALKWLADTYFENRFIELKKSSKIFKAKYLEDRKDKIMILKDRLSCAKEMRTGILKNNNQ